MTEAQATPAERAEALMEKGAALTDVGRYEKAEPLLREALGLVRGTGGRAECRACGNLGVLFAQQERRFEALLLFRRGLAMGRALGHPMLQALHLSNIASEFAGLELWTHARAALDELEALAANQDEEEQRQILDLVLWPRAWMAVERGDLEEARDFLVRYRRFLADRDDAMARVTLLALEATLLRREGRAEEALRLVDGWEGEAPTLDASYVRSLRLECLEALGRDEEARIEARRLLAGLEGGGGGEGPGDLAIELAMDVARCLEGDPESAPLARRAYDHAATVTLSRIAALDRLVEALPELATLSDEDHAWIRDLEDWYRKEQGTLLEHVAALLRRARDDDAAFLYTGGEDRSLVRICAWCVRVATREGRWLPLAHYIPADPEILVTHGICPDCRQAAGGRA